MIDASKFAGFLDFMHTIETQDNVCTAKPIIIELQMPRRIYTKDGSGMGEGKAVDVLGIDECEEYGVDPEEILHWDVIWEGKQWFFTLGGYQKHLELNGHNYPDRGDGGPRPYIYSLGYRNPEMKKLFEWMVALKEELLCEGGSRE